MKKSFIILVEIGILYVVLRSSFAQYLFEDVHQTLSDWMVTVANMPKQATLEEIRNSMTVTTSNFSERQMQYFQDVTANSSQILRFHRLYCEGDDKNPFLYGASLNQFCTEISARQQKLGS